MSELKLRIGFHTKQREVFQDPHKIRIVCAGRRWGKSRLLLNDAVLSALSFPGTVDPISPEVILLTEPTRVQATGILWLPLVALCESPEVSPYVAKINRSEYRIDFKCGKPSIIVTGANDRDGDGLRGKRIYRCYADEAQDMKPGILDTVIMPAMADTPGSRALLTLTPKGKLNHTYELIQRATSEPDTYSFYHGITADNPAVPREEIERARRTLPPRIFRQEMEASIEDFAGKVYTELSSENLIPEPFECERYFMGIDHGELYPAVGVLGLHKGTWVFMEGWTGNYKASGSAQPIPQPTVEAEIVRLARKYNIDGCYCDPSRPSAILGLRALGYQHRLPGLQKAQAAYNRIADGISQVHSLIYQRKLLFPQQGQDDRYPDRIYGLEAMMLMESYHYVTDKKGQVTEVPADGLMSHICDLIRYTIALPTAKPGEDLA